MNMQDKKAEAKEFKDPSRLLMPFVALLILTFSLVTSSVAWFSVVRSSGNLGFNAGAQGSLVMHIGTVAVDGEESERSFALCTDNRVGISPPVASDSLYSIKLSDMSFGTIDNLSRLKPENIVYLRLTVPKNNGTRVDMSLKTVDGSGSYFFDVYRNIISADGESIAGQEKLDASNASDKAVLDGLQAIRDTEGESFLEFSYAFSETSYNQITESAALDFSDTVQFDTEGVVTANCPEEVVSNASDNYYLYIKITPNLNAFAYSIEYLTPLMPCFVLFNVGVEFDVMSEVTAE